MRRFTLATIQKRKVLIGIGMGLFVLTLLMFIDRPASPADAAWQEEVEFYKKRNQWQFSVISDMDQASKVDVEDDHPYWQSFLQKATLVRDPHSGRYTVSWDEKRLTVKTVINEKGRAMELSDLVRYAGSLYTCDDRTGIVYELVEDGTKAQAIPRYILMDGDGDSTKGFKCEWGTVKDNLLYIGSFGKEYTSENGEILNQNPMWVKVIDTEGRVRHQNWTDVFTGLRIATKTEHPGYLFHESAHWNPMLKRWFFLPRRLSTEKYDPKADESKGANTLISTSETFGDHQVLNLGDVKHPTRGFSCFRFIPGRLDEILAIKSEEVGMTTASYITVFNLKGEILLEETHFVDGVKYEGLEFL